MNKRNKQIHFLPSISIGGAPINALRLITELKKTHNLDLFGVGGPKLEALGVSSLFNFSEINIMGLIDPLINYRRLLQLRESLIKIFREEKIDFFIGIDSPDFNIGIHKALKTNSINKNIQIVSPSVWGWRQNRIKSIKKYIDLTMCLFDFEHNFYQDHNHKSIHLGHPFFNLNKIDREITLHSKNLSSNKKYISIIPGSRKSEIQNMFPTYVEFMKKFSEKNKDHIFLIPVADNKTMTLVQKLSNDLNANAVIEQNSMKEFLSISEFSVVTSGTATLESAILGCPPIICYKTNFLNYAIISRMLKVDNIGLPNLLLGKRYFSELLQNECTKENIYNASRDIFLLKEDSKNIANILKAKLQGVGFENAAKEIFLI